MLVLKKRNLVIGLLVILLIITGYLNFAYKQSNINRQDDKDKLAKNGDIDNSAVGSVSINDLANETLEDEKSLDRTIETSSSSFFRDYRFEREQERNKEMDYISSIVDNPNSDNEMIKEAQAQLLELTSNMEKELIIENLIKAKGFNEAVVLIHNNYVNIIVEKLELEPEHIAILTDIVRRESGVELENIKIMSKI